MCGFDGGAGCGYNGFILRRLLLGARTALGITDMVGDWDMTKSAILQRGLCV